MATSTRRISKEGRAIISRTQKARWAKQREEQAAQTTSNGLGKKMPQSVMIEVSKIYDEETFKAGLRLGYSLGKREA